MELEQQQQVSSLKFLPGRNVSTFLHCDLSSRQNLQHSSLSYSKEGLLGRLMGLNLLQGTSSYFVLFTIEILIIYPFKLQ